MNLPAAIFGQEFLSSARRSRPRQRSGRPERRGGEKGPGRSALPASSAITVRSRKVPPWPPNSSGMSSPGHPRPTSLSQKAASWAVSCAIIWRTNLVEQLSVRKRLAASRNISCSSEKPKSNFISFVAPIDHLRVQVCPIFDCSELPLSVPMLQARRRSGVSGARGQERS